MSEYTIKTVSGSVVRFDDAGDGLPLTNCEVNIVPTIETGTASASVVTFSDGADNIPIKSCVITVPPTLDGISELDVNHTGKNLLKIDSNNYLEGQKCEYEFTDSGIEITATGNYARVGFSVPVKTGATYTFSCYAYSSSSYRRIYLKSSTSSPWSSPFYNKPVTDVNTFYSYTFTSSSDVLFIGFYVTSTETSGTMSISNLMLEVSQSATEYEPYSVPTTHTASLGRTIYGGEVDVINGNCEPTNIVDVPSNLTSGTSGGLTFSASFDGAISYSGTTSGTWAYMTSAFDFAIKSGQTFTFSRNTAFSYIHRIRLTFSDDTTENVSISANDTSVTYTPEKDIISIRLIVAGLTADTSYNDTVYLQLQYGNTATAYSQYFTTFTFTPIPINSRLGNNTMWSDGDLYVTYYKNGYNTKKVNILHYGKNLAKNILIGSDNRRYVPCLYIDAELLPKTQYTLSFYGTNGNSVYVNEKLFTFNAFDIGTEKVTVIVTTKETISKNDGNQYTINRGWIFLKNNKNQDYDNVFDDCQLELGASATDYISPDVPSINAITLGAPIHGGTINVLKGTGISKYDMAAFEDCTWSCVTSYQSNFNSTNGIISVRFGKTAMGNAGYALTTEGVVCNNFANNNRSVWNNADRLNEIGYTDGIVINMHYSDIGLEAWTDNSSTTLAAWKSSELYLSGIFALIKAEPEYFTFTPIQLTSHSSNTLWSTEGDVTVSYYSYIETDGRYLIYGDTLTDIADAIREKTSIVGPINVNDFVTDIMTIDDAAPDAEEVEF